MRMMGEEWEEEWFMWENPLVSGKGDPDKMGKKYPK